MTMAWKARWKGRKGEGHGEVEDRDGVLGFGRKRVEIGDERGGEMSIWGKGEIGEGVIRSDKLEIL